MTRTHAVTKLVERVARAREWHRERHRPTGFGFALADSIAYMPSDHWDRLTAHGTLFLGRPYLNVLERTAPDNLQPRYALAFRGRTPVAAVAAQLVAVSASRVFKADAGSVRRKGPASLRRAVASAVRKVRAKAIEHIRTRLLVCGNLLSWGFHGIAFAPDEHPAELWPAVAEALYRIRRSERLSGQTDFVLIKDIPDEHADVAAALARFSYRPVQTDPDMVLDIPADWRSYDDYLASLTSRYRKAARQIVRDVEAAGCRVERLTDLNRHADRLHALYLQVHEHAQVRPVTVRADYLPALAAIAGDRLRCSVIRRHDTILGFVTTLKDGEAAVGYYLGFDRAANAAIPLYFRLMLEVVADAIALGCRSLSFGRTALEPKARLGATAAPLRIWVRHRVPIANLLLRNLLHVVPHEEAPVRSPFK